MSEPLVNLAHPANKTALEYLKSMGRNDGRSEVEYPADQANPYQLFAHPDLLEILWTNIVAHIPHEPHRPAVVVYGRPVLVNPTSGVLFGAAIGTFALFLRFSQPDRERLLADKIGAIERLLGRVNMNAALLGEDWLYYNIAHSKGYAEWGRKAFEYAETLK